jgi:hypothetical protein
MSSNENGRLVNHIPESYYNSNTLRVDENEDSPLVNIFLFRASTKSNGNANCSTNCALSTSRWFSFSGPPLIRLGDFEMNTNCICYGCFLQSQRISIVTAANL